MLMKLRKVRRSSKFTSRLGRTSRQRREYAASVYAMAVIQALLSTGLAVAAVRSFQAIGAQAPQAAVWLRLVLPGVFIAGALLSLRSSWRNMRSARELHRRPDAED